MSVIPDHFKVDFQPIAQSDAMICIGNACFTILTERLIRLEYHPQAEFEDRATQRIWYREQPIPDYTH